MTVGIGAMVVHEFLRTCHRVPNKTALIVGDERISYGALARQVAGLAACLRSRSIAPGDRVAILLDNSAEYAAAVHAIAVIGAVLVPISPLVKSDKLAYILRDTEAKALVTHARLEFLWRRAAADVPFCIEAGADGSGNKTMSWPRDDDPHELLSADAAAADDDLAAIIYTSGTTGVPKGVMLTHANMRSAWDSVQSYLQLRDDDVIGLALSASFSYGLYFLLMGLGSGATVVLERASALPAVIVQTLERERVTVFPGVPTMFSAILGLSTLPAADLRALRIVTNAAAALPERHARCLQDLLPGAKLFLMYGMTECKRISYLPPEQVANRPTSVGRGMPGQTHWLVDAGGNRLPNGSTGELVVAGNHVMRGYWRKPAETAERLKPGPGPRGVVLHTGDIFRTDEEGWLYFVARRDDIIKSRGEKVAPREVENVIYELDAVRDCAVIGIDDEFLGQAVKAFVALKPGSHLTERDVIRHCLARLETYMAPKTVAFVAEFPRTPSGKIAKADLH